MKQHKWEKRAGKQFLSRMDEVVLAIGRDAFTRREVIERLQCANFRAVATLHGAVERFKPKSVLELAKRLTIEKLGGIDGVGYITALVWLNVLEDRGIDPNAWIGVDGMMPTICANSKKKKKCR